jgi:hypothetical protein
MVRLLVPSRRHRPRPLSIQLRAVTLETHVVIPVGADFAAIPEPGGMPLASAANVTGFPMQGA